MTTDIEKAPGDLQQLVAEVDTGGRKPVGVTAKVIFGVALAWALFQTWYASPLPFALRFGVLNDTEARALHLAFALFLAFLAWPAGKRSPRDRVPWQDWVFAAAGAFASAYLMLFYNTLAMRPGQPTALDLAVSVTGLVLLLEATRRAVGAPMAVLAVLFIAYALFGPYLPELVSHKGASFSRLMSHMWLTTEGVFGIALGVSTGTIFVYVLFGALLDRGGGGNYMMQVSFAALGHLRGGPAKVSVVSSALNGMISGSSVSNVVSGGIFTIPLMKKAGYGGVKAGAIETMSSVDGQIMPPVMGAAAFLMVEYVGIPYSEIVKHAFLPAILSYLGLFYIVHLEALKLGMRPIIRARAAAMAGADAALRARHLGQRRRLRAHLLDAGRHQPVSRLGRALGNECCRRRALPVRGEAGGGEPRPATGHRHRRPAPARDMARGPRRPALPAAGRHADLVPDGRGDVAVAVGLLGDRDAGRSDDRRSGRSSTSSAAYAHRASGPPAGTSSSRASTTARAT